MTNPSGWGEGYFVAAHDWPSRHELSLTTEQIYEALSEVKDYVEPGPSKPSSAEQAQRTTGSPGADP